MPAGIIRIAPGRVWITSVDLGGSLDIPIYVRQPTCSRKAASCRCAGSSVPSLQATTSGGGGECNRRRDVSLHHPGSGLAEVPASQIAPAPPVVSVVRPGVSEGEGRGFLVPFPRAGRP